MTTIALVAPYPPSGERHGGHSGVASYTANLAHALAAAGADVHVIAPVLDGDPPEFDDGPVAVHRAFRLGLGALPSAARAINALNDQYRFDVVHLQWELFLYGGASALAGLVPALASLHRGNTTLVTTMHQVVDPAEVDRTYTRLHRVALPATLARSGIAGVQQAIRKASAATIVHETAFAAHVPGATVIPHGIEISSVPDRESSRRVLGLDDRFTVLCFGFLAPYKGLETALQAAALAGPSVHLVVAGGEHPRLAGTTGFGDELRHRYGHVARFTGWVPDEHVSAWFAAADVAVFPYPKPFASSGVLALALAHGTPVLLSPALARCAGAPSVVAAPLEPAAMADCFEHLARKPAALDELRQWTEILATGRRWPAIADRHLALYREVMRQPPPRLLPPVAHQEVCDVERTAAWSLRAG